MEHIHPNSTMFFNSKTKNSTNHQEKSQKISTIKDRKLFHDVDKSKNQQNNWKKLYLHNYDRYPEYLILES